MTNTSMHQKDQKAQGQDQAKDLTQDPASDLMRSIGLPAEQMAAMREGMSKLIRDLSAGTKGANTASLDWEAKNQFATQSAGLGRVAGYNSGPIAPGLKPAESLGMSMGEALNRVEPVDLAPFDPSAGSPAPRLKPDTPENRAVRIL
jgi:hypothetical protein